MKYLLMAAAAVAVMVAPMASAQDTDPLDAATEVTYGGYTYDVPADQPLVVYIESKSETQDGVSVSYLVFARLANGDIVPLTAEPVTPPPGMLDDKAVGDAVILQNKVANP